MTFLCYINAWVIVLSDTYHTAADGTRHALAALECGNMSPPQGIHQLNDILKKSDTASPSTFCIICAENSMEYEKPLEHPTAVVA
jgi:hypothetical protein